MKILIVDDIEVSLDLLEARLERNGYETASAMNGIEALDKLKSDSIDMIISDILMPRMDGFQLCRECKKDDTLRKIPFVFYTATYTGKKDEEFALSLGAEKFIVKPMENKRFMETIEGILKNHKKGLLLLSEMPVEKEETVYLKEYSGRLIEKLDKKILQLEKTEKTLQKRTYALNERVKELNCLFGISQLVQEQDISLEEITQGIVTLIPPAWQYPEITCARIILEDQEFRTENFRETIWKQASDITVHSERLGTLEVYYLEEKPERDEGPFLKEERDLVIVIAERLGKIIERKRTAEKLEQSYIKLQKALDGAINALASAIEMRDPYTAGHQQRVAKLSCAIAGEMGLSEKKVREIHMVAIVHDTGKIHIPSEMLSKPSRLTDIEFDMIKTHSQAGHDILEKIEFPWPIAQIVLQHHERVDGSGYPQGLKGEEILLEARIIAVADVVEAMASHRPYRPAQKIEDALEEISRNKDILYDPQVVDTCLRLFSSNKGNGLLLGKQ